MVDTQQSITDFLNHLAGLGHKETTISGSRCNLNFFAGYLREKGITDLLAVTAEIIDGYRQKVMAAELAVATKKKRLRIVARLFIRLKKTNSILVNPAVGLGEGIRTGRRIMPVLSIKEVQKLLEQPDTRTETGLRDRAIIELFYSSALRRCELCNLKVDDFDPLERTVTIRNGKGGKDRIVPVGESACHYLRRYLDEVRAGFSGNEWFFLTRYGTPLQGGTVKDFLRRYQNQAGITKQLGSHILRRSCATHMLQQGGDIRHIQELLGHKHLKTCLLYTVVMDSDLKRAHNKYHPGRNL